MFGLTLYPSINLQLYGLPLGDGLLSLFTPLINSYFLPINDYIDSGVAPFSLYALTYGMVEYEWLRCSGIV